jgi:hypothetical protein
MNINANTTMEIVKVLLAVGVASWGIYEYYYKDRISKIDRAQGYVKEHVEMTAKTAVDDFWALSKRENKVSFEWDQNTAKTDDIAEKKYKIATYESIGGIIANDHELRKNVHKLQQFYYNVAVCLNDGICDLETTCDAFFGDVFGYRLIHIEYLKQFASEWSIDKNTQMERLVQTCNLFQATRK